MSGTIGCIIAFLVMYIIQFILYFSGLKNIVSLIVEWKQILWPFFIGSKESMCLFLSASVQCGHSPKTWRIPIFSEIKK